MDEFLNVLIRSSDDTHVRLKSSGTTDRAILVAIEKAKQADLHRARHLAEFIEKERAPVGPLEAAVTAVLGRNAPFSEVQRGLGELDHADRRALGEQVNAVREQPPRQPARRGS